MLFYRSLVRCFGKLNKQEVIDSSYEELTRLMVRKYGMKEYKNNNAACLHQIQHHFQVLTPGDWVLDVGAGPHFYWTDLALKMTQNSQETHKVVSNDIVPNTRGHPNNPFVLGDIRDEQTKTNLALNLGENKFDTILVDVSVAFTGELEKDSIQINSIIQQALFFSNIFLKKGGNFVCKVLESQSSKIIEQTCKIYFHQFSSFRPSILRQRCPVKFFIMKGFAMNHSLSALKQFLSKYRGSAKNKIDLVKQYQGKYNWDPIDVLNKRAKDDILSLRQRGRSEKDIQNMFINDPHIKIGQIMKQLRALEKAKHSNDQTLIQKAINKYSDGKLFQEANEVPTTREEWINFLEKIQNDIKQFKNNEKKKKEKKEKLKHNLAPLQDDQVYMKNAVQVPEERQEPIYIEADLVGNYSTHYEQEYIDQQLSKLSRLNKKGVESIQQMRRSGKKIKLEDIFKTGGVSEEQMEKEIYNLGEAFRAVTDEQYKEMMDKEGYEEEIQEILGKKDNEARHKYRNK